MKKTVWIMILLFAFCSCEGHTEQTAEVTTEATYQDTYVSYNSDGAFLSRIDFTKYSDRLDEQQKAELAFYLPVLENKQTFIWQDFHDKNAAVTMADVHKSFWEGIEDAPRDLTVNGFAMLDITGDGANELVLYLNDIGGHYIVLHRENDSVYGIDFPIRTFFLMKNGVYAGSGGAATHWYYQLSFENGRFVETELGSIDEYFDENAEICGGEYIINGVEVGKEEFEEWMKTIYADDVKYIMIED